MDNRGGQLLDLQHVRKELRTDPMSMANETVTEILSRYERERLPLLKPRTRKDYARALEQLRTHLGDKVAAQLTPHDLAEFMNVAKGKIQRNRQLAILSATFTEAIRWGWLHANICKEVQRHTSKRRDRDLTDEEYEQLKQMARPRTRHVMDLVLYTGQSPGQITSLRWAQVYEDKILFRNPHTNKKVTVEITPKIAEVLTACGWKRHPRPEFVIVTRKGVPYTNEGFRAGWQRTMRKWRQGGNDIVTFHDIRKKWARANPLPPSLRDGIAAISPDEAVIKPRVFRVPKVAAVRTAAAVMMPFKGLMRVYEAIREACSDTGFECRRADDMWEESTVIQDIFNLIYRSHVVIVDFTYKNANVLYETGIAHTLGRHVIPIVQNMDDVPFDIKHHRVLVYSADTDAGLAQLRQSLAARLRFVGE